MYSSCESKCVSFSLFRPTVNFRLHSYEDWVRSSARDGQYSQKRIKIHTCSTYTVLLVRAQFSRQDSLLCLLLPHFVYVWMCVWTTHTHDFSMAHTLVTLRLLLCLRLLGASIVESSFGWLPCYFTRLFAMSAELKRFFWNIMQAMLGKAIQCYCQVVSRSEGESEVVGFPGALQ